MKAVILCTNSYNPGDLSWDRFLEILPDVEMFETTKTSEKAAERIKDAEIVLAPDCQLSAEVLSTNKNIKYIGCLSTGYNYVDLDYCKKNNIVVTNIPSYGTQMVSQYAIALLLEICCQVGHHSHAVHQDRWEKSGRNMFWDYPIIELKDKTMGIIGFGRIGKNTAKIGQALGMKVIYSDTHRSVEVESETCQYRSQDEVLSESDVIMIHCPLFPETHHLINKENIAKMKDGVILINNARGPIVDEYALADALYSGKIYAAGLDVVDKEPLTNNSPLMNAPRCFITPHISWVARESRARLLNIAIDNIEAFLKGAPINTVC